MIVASRYSKSLLELAVEKNLLEKVYEDAKLILSACRESRDLLMLIKSPVIKADKKVQVITSVFGKSLNELSLNFILLLVNKKRENILPEICTSFIEAYRAHKKITSATITTAVKLDEQTRKKALEMVKKVTTGEIVLEEKVNPELIGGFILRVGDRQIDSSVSSQLQKLKKNFNTKTVTLN